jgi:integrase
LTAFWDWAVLELLVQSGLRVEEALELTTLDVLKRRLADGRVYYMLHVKPSKFDRARVLPIGDGLGRVIAAMVRHIKRAYGTDHVPPCDAWDWHEKRPLPRAPYLMGASRQAGVPGPNAVRDRLARLSSAAGARRADARHCDCGRTTVGACSLPSI